MPQLGARGSYKREQRLTRRAVAMVAMSAIVRAARAPPCDGWRMRPVASEVLGWRGLPVVLAAALAGCAAGDAAATPDATVAFDAAAGDVAAAPDADAGARPPRWSLGYYATWMAGAYPVEAIDWSGLTELGIAFYVPQPDGSLKLLGGNPDVVAALVAAAHAHGVAAIASVGGAGSGAPFEQDSAGVMRAAFVGRIAALVAGVGFDGVDIDWEPLARADEPIVIDLANRLRAAHPGLRLTLTLGFVNPNVPRDLSGAPALAAAFDQLDLMTYGMAGAWPGWSKSWHNSPLYSQDAATPLSIDSTVRAYLAAGVPAARLGIGIGLYGLCYGAPVTAPLQPLDGATVLAGDETMSYAHIAADYLAVGARTFDPLARVPYLSFVAAHAPDGCTYVSYDDAQSIADKGAYVKAMGLGGVIEWEINEGYLPSAPAGARNPLLDAVRDAVLR